MNTEKTRQLLQPLISRPPLTDQLLERPPFRFLLDIVTEVCNRTSFLEDVFAPEELNIATMISKETKVAFLQKLISILNTDGSLDGVKPGKILAGKEAEMTNLLLQKLATDAGQFLLHSSEKHVNNTEKQQKEHKVRSSSKSSGDAKFKKHRKLKDGSEERRKKKEESLETKEVKKEKRRKNGECQSNVKDVDGDKAVENQKKHRNRDKSQLSKERLRSEAEEHNEMVKEGGKKKTKHRRSASSSKEKAEKVRSIAEHAIVTGDTLAVGNDDGLNVADLTNHDELAVSNKNTDHQSKGMIKTLVNDADDGPNESEIPLPLPPKPEQQKAFHVSVPYPTHPHVSLERPGTAVARAAPPKLRKKKIAEIELKTESVAEVAPVILSERSDADETNFIIDGVDGATEQHYTEPDEGKLNAEEHGTLVKRILETKKELESGLDPYFSPVVQDESQRNQNKIEVEDMQNAVQGLTQALHPLARLFDYAQEDVDNMVQEMNEWRLEKQNRDAKTSMADAKINVEKEKLLITLKKLDGEIKEKRTAIARVRANIIENDKNIAVLLNNL